MIYNPDIWVPETPSYITESQTAFTNIETSSGETLTTAEKIAIDKFIRLQVLAGNWSKRRSFVFPHLSTENKSRRDWFAVRDATNVGGCAWTQSGGWVTDGISKYIDTGFIPSTDYGSIVVTNSQFGIYVIGGTNGNIFSSIGSTAANQITFNTNSGAVGNHQIRNYSSGNVINTSTTSGTISHATYSLWRIPGNLIGYHINATGSAPQGSIVSAFSNRSIYIGARNNNGTADGFNAIQVGSYWAGSETDFDHTAWNQSLRMMMQELGVDSWRIQPIYKAGYEYNRYTVQPNDALIYWLGGQSNQNQYHNVTAIATFLQAANSNVKVWNASAVAWQTLTPGTNGNPPDQTKGGRIERFAHTLSLYKPGQIYLLSWAKSATGIATSAGDDWNVSSGPADLYPTFINSYLLPAIANLIAAGKRPMFMGISWDQGENEASLGATTYSVDLVNMLNGVINNAYTNGADCSRLVVLLKRLHNNTTSLWANQSAVRAVHEDVGRNLQVKLSTHACIRKVEYYNTDNDNGYIHLYEENPDPVHYSVKSADAIAYAEAVYHASFLK